jgi:hypothetical protein
MKSVNSNSDIVKVQEFLSAGKNFKDSGLPTSLRSLWDQIEKEFSWFKEDDLQMEVVSEWSDWSSDVVNSLMRPWTDEELAELYGDDEDVVSVEKHGSHDQSSHGRKGGSGSDSSSDMVADKAPSSTRSPEAAKEAVALRARSAALEPKITEMVVARAGEHGGEVVGLRNRLKSTDSLARKIDADAVKEHGGDRAASAAAVSDSVRYTVKFDEEDYTNGVTATLESLERDGYSVRAKNFWQQGDPYQGMNVKATKDGVTVELQFHTNSSFRAKASLHPVYEEYRASKDNKVRRQAWDRMVQLASAIPKPAGYVALLTVGSLTMQQFETAQQAGLMG